MRDKFNRDKELQYLCGFEDLYQWQREHNVGQEFILHDGPPYANGQTHVGHAINKILKDIINRYNVLKGKRVHYIPGWDCHGLPIELLALKNRRNAKLTPVEIREEAQKFAGKAIQSQMESFKDWGIMADWNDIYCTFDAKYETKQLDVFLHMFEKGYLYQDFMPVYWSPSSRTALAESELEYNEAHVSTSVYVRLKITQKSSYLNNITGANKMFGVIWTTTPWTLPANQAVCYNSDTRYCLLKDQITDDVYICEESFETKLRSIVQNPLTSMETITGSEFKDTKYAHPLTNENLSFLPASHVTKGKGTGLVHTAPAHGHDDFQLAKQYNITVKSLLDDNCCYTSDAGPELNGKTIGKDSETVVLDMLGNDVIHTEEFTHSYPYDWRTKKPVIIRTSRQWFIDTAALKSRALECLEDVNVYPSNLRSNLPHQLHTRTYWCISRQRVWGVPIPVFYHKLTNQPLINSGIIKHVRDLISQHGSGCWWTMTDEELLPTSLIQQYESGTSADYTRGKDILDIWFDSGSSWAAVLDGYQQADIYLEGTDQFGGWFQSSLLTSVAVQDKAPYRNLVVHGFTMDEDGKKMSKSIGNVVDPNIVIKGGKNKDKEPSYGADVLRWWAALSNLQPHSTIGKTKLDAIHHDLYELRKTLRYLLGNISVGCTDTLIDYDKLWPQDKYMLYQLYQIGNKVDQYYNSYRYTKLLQDIDKFCKEDVSKFYAGIVKDRCYCDDENGAGRQASLTTQFYILDLLVHTLAPILPHLTEEIYYHYPDYRRTPDTDSIFKTGWFSLPEEWNNVDITYTIQPVLDIRDHLIDNLQSESSIEFDVMVYCSNLLYDRLKELQSEHSSSSSPLCEILQTSSITLTNKPLTLIPDDIQMVNGVCNVTSKDGSSSQEEYVMIIKDTEQFMCERCRRFTALSPNSPCPRCIEVLATGWEL
ncbi:Isoleucine--tRNA ligase [Mactra antiquata]